MLAEVGRFAVRHPSASAVRPCSPSAVFFYRAEFDGLGGKGPARNAGAGRRRRWAAVSLAGRRCHPSCVGGVR